MSSRRYRVYRDVENIECNEMHRPSRFCGNKNSSNRKVQYIHRYDGYFLVVNNVPCEECEYCGERYFKADVLKTIEKEFVKIFSAKKKPKKQLRVPVEEFAELKQIVNDLQLLMLNVEI